MRTAEERLDVLDEMLTGAARRRLLMLTPDDEPLDGRTIALDGRRVVSFGSCSYLALEMDARLRRGAVAAVEQYGTQFSSSRTYLQAPPYLELEARLSEMFGRPALLAPSTTLGHICAIPVIVGSGDAVILDQQVHHSVQMAVDLARARGTPVEMIRHSSIEELDATIRRLSRRHQRVWYMFDGIYSMFGDYAPHADLAELLDRHDQLHIYADDSHGIGWAGRHGRGPTLDRLGEHERLIVVGSLNKAFAAAGGALTFPTDELCRRVRTLAGPMIFSGPVQPPMLGAALASVHIHLSDELPTRQAALAERIQRCTHTLGSLGLPLAARDPAPIRYLTLGLPRLAQHVVQKVMTDGFYTNLAMFPAVPMTEAGVRLTLTLHHTDADIDDLCASLDHRIRETLATQKRPVPLRKALRLEHGRTIADVPAQEWDALLGDRGTFTARGLAFLERVFTPSRDRPEDRWAFHYYAIRDGAGVPVLATFFTEALWKDDLLATAATSEEVERRRVNDPYYLTSRTLAMGCPLTEGDHLYLDRRRDWRAALELLLASVRETAASSSATMTVLRDLDGSDPELHDVLGEHGFARFHMPDSLEIASVDPDDATWLSGLTERARRHQRREVLAYDDTLELEILGVAGRHPGDVELKYLHRLYRNVWSRNLELNTFDLPPELWREMLTDPCWEIILLRIPGRAAPVGFGAHFVGREHYAPMIIGLDYDYVSSHHVYRQALRQALLRARAHGAKRLLLGMGAPLEKQRFGARPHSRSAYIQTRDHYGADAIATLWRH